MCDPRIEPSGLTEFDLICATLEDYEHLPEIVPGPVERPQLIGRFTHEDSIDAEILAGLVQP